MVDAEAQAALLEYIARGNTVPPDPRAWQRALFAGAAALRRDWRPVQAELECDDPRAALTEILAMRARIEELETLRHPPRGSDGTVHDWQQDEAFIEQAAYTLPDLFKRDGLTYRERELGRAILKAVRASAPASSSKGDHA